MEISIRRIAKESSLSGEKFEPGDVAESFLYRNPEGELERADLHLSELEAFEVPETLLCRWRHRVRDADTSEADARKRSIASAEEMFLALLEREAELPEGEPLAMESRTAREQLVLLNLLALMLERRRILKAIPGGYWHTREKRNLRIRRVDLDPAEIAPLLVELENLI